MAVWYEVCDAILDDRNKNLSMWSDIIYPLYDKRLQEIISHEFSTILVTTQKQLTKAKELINSSSQSPDSNLQQ